jgi:hypothetical protein
MNNSDLRLSSALEIVVRPAVILAVAIACAVNSPSSANAQPRLTGAVLFSTDGAGNFDNDSWWNTLADGIAANLYVTHPNSGVSGPFINSGDVNPATRINVLLAPGTYIFHIFGEPGNDRPRTTIKIHH